MEHLRWALQSNSNTRSWRSFPIGMPFCLQTSTAVSMISIAVSLHMFTDHYMQQQRPVSCNHRDQKSLDKHFTAQWAELTCSAWLKSQASTQPSW